MRRARLAERTFAALISISAAAIVLMAAASALSMRRLYSEATLSALAQSAAALANAAQAVGQGGQALDAFCDRAAAGTGLRVTAIAPDGSVLGDSGSDTGAMDNHAGRPEIASALRGQAATSMRPSPTLGITMAYAAAPILSGDAVTGVVRIAMGAPELRAGMAPFIAAFAAVAAAMIAAMAAASARIGASVARPMGALQDTAKEWSAGRLDRRARRFDDPELGPLADTMNAMAAELADRVVAMESQKRELEAILDGMGEAVISTDENLVIRLANPKARELLGRAGDEEGLEGRGVLKACGSVALDEMARRCASGGVREEAEITLYGEGTRYLWTNAAPLPLGEGRSGVVIVLNDITRLKRLERVRKDFVANVSHELRTPITLIKGFIETLEDVRDPAEAKRFLGIAGRHADRMTSIIEDLLTLARLEGPERGGVEASRVDALRVMERAVESIGDVPASKGVSIRLRSEPGLAVMANEGLLEQALLNLLDNAVKYGPEGGTIRVEASREASPGGGFARFAVIDDGPGIPARDVPRLFERFYRVDRARSRELGGTGLGLAIVRHIALAHGGDASVESREGSGSSFIVRIPLWTGDESATGADSVQAASPDADTATVSS
ncbi:MAG: PAS domain S-box protein [Spirochaetes bacterium]|nr:PAS domain S-box protein [Spirochaetota bacterium]MBU1082037.1 PAS domain S-box protein [Spirochaetota bacterium]